MAKPQEKGIQTIVQLLDAGYPYVIQQPITSLTELVALRTALGPLEKILGRNFTLQDTTYLGNFAGNSMGKFDAIVKHRACSEIRSDDPIYNNFNIDPVTRQFAMKRYRCFLLRKDQALEMKLFHSFKLYLSGRAGRIFTGLKESGIYSFWFLAEGWSGLQGDRALQINLAEGVEHSKQPQSISLDSHIQIVFFLLLIGLSIGLIGFGIETFIGGIFAKSKVDKKIRSNREIVLNSLGALNYSIRRVARVPEGNTCENVPI